MGLGESSACLEIGAGHQLGPSELVFDVDILANDRRGSISKLDRNRYRTGGKQFWVWNGSNEGETNAGSKS